MREIKFRAWDKRDEEMYTPTNIMLSNSKKVWIADKKVFNDMRHLVEEESKFRNIGDSAVLMQFTGLKDKRGEEIYEGDILAEKEGKKYRTVGLVIWSEKEVCYILRLKDSWDVLDKVNEEYCEVIGNVYKNSELLEFDVNVLTDESGSKQDG